MGGHPENPNVIEVIEVACDECPMGGYEVTNACRGCLAHRCEGACRRGAITFDQNHTAHIDKTKCVDCGACAKVCPYSAIVSRKRPCQNACKVKAISVSENLAALIDNEKCTSCGACVYQCPFGAIMDKSFILDAIDIIKKSEENTNYKTFAVVAPSISSQFTYAKLGQVITGLKKLGFHTVIEAALGADMVAMTESAELVEKGFLTSSCCPAFVSYIKKSFPDLIPLISHNPSPMAAIAKYLKETDSPCKVVFIGPCTAKKAEAQLEDVKSYVDCVLTFEELQGMFDAKEIDFKTLEADPADGMDEGSGFGRGFAVGGGVAAAVVEAIKHIDPDREILIEYGDGLKECRKMLAMAKAGKRNGYLLEGMGCPGGCVAGAGTLRPVKESTASVERFKNAASSMSTTESPYLGRLKDVEEKC